MNHWPFIFAAYGLTGLATFVIVVWSFASMRRAERKADEVGRDR